MNILFLTMSNNMKDIKIHGIYTDLLREFIKNGHNIYAVAPAEKRLNEETNLIKGENYSILRVKTGNVQKCSPIEKGISQVRLEGQFIKAIDKYYKNIKFDLVMYSTPPITFSKVVSYIKKRDNAKTYLLLKDIFPQNAVDLGMFSKSSLIYKYFRKKEKKLYEQSDIIGCMSKANMEYIIKHNPQVNPEKVEVCPNSIEVIEKNITDKEKCTIRKKYNLPLDKKIFVYGGNLGKPQGIGYLIDCINSQKDNKDVFFLVVGAGTEYSKLKEYADKEEQKNFKLLSVLPKEEYEILVDSCDVGMIFLDKRFTIPNFPSRLLSYMQAKMPVLAVTDVNTDVGKVIEEGNFGWWCEAGKIEDFCEKIGAISSCNENELKILGQNGFKHLKTEYTVKKGYEIIMKHFS